VFCGASGLLLLLEAGIDSGNTTPGSVELSIIGGNAMILTKFKGKGGPEAGLSIWCDPVDQSNMEKIMEILRNEQSRCERVTHGYRRLVKG
jgi:hypothetical protein